MVKTEWEREKRKARRNPEGESKIQVLETMEGLEKLFLARRSIY